MAENGVVACFKIYRARIIRLSSPLAPLPPIWRVVRPCHSPRFSVFMCLPRWDLPGHWRGAEYCRGHGGTFLVTRGRSRFVFYVTFFGSNGFYLYLVMGWPLI